MLAGVWGGAKTGRWRWLSTEACHAYGQSYLLYISQRFREHLQKTPKAKSHRRFRKATKVARLVSARHQVVCKTTRCHGTEPAAHGAKKVFSFLDMFRGLWPQDYALKGNMSVTQVRSRKRPNRIGNTSTQAHGDK